MVIYRILSDHSFQITIFYFSENDYLDVGNEFSKWKLLFARICETKNIHLQMHSYTSSMKILYFVHCDVPKNLHFSWYDPFCGRAKWSFNISLRKCYNINHKIYIYLHVCLIQNLDIPYFERKHLCAKDIDLLFLTKI